MISQIKKREKPHVLSKILPAGEANMGMVGPSLAPKGIKAMDFIKQFNDATAKHKGTNVTVLIEIYKDKSFKMRVRHAQAADAIRKAAQVKKGSSNPGRDTAGSITWEQLLEIARNKINEFPNATLAGICKTLSGTARSCGIKVEGDFEEMRGKLEAQEQYISSDRNSA